MDADYVKVNCKRAGNGYGSRGREGRYLECKLLRLFYVSTAAPDIDEGDIAEIATKASEKNRRLNITGALAFNGVNFAQILEGEANIVTDLLETIRADERHNGLIVVNSKAIIQRAYHDWSMKRIDGLSFDEFLTCMVEVEPPKAA